MNEFSLGLAIYDFAPVILTGVAVYFIARLTQFAGVARTELTLLGASLVFSAGLLKALWKLTVTLTGQDVLWMSNALFPLMAPGFILLAAGMWASNRQLAGRPVPTWLWWLPVGLIVLAVAVAAYRTWVAPIERGWFMPMMSLASVGNIALTSLLLAAAWRRGKRPLALLFVVNLVMVFALIPIAQIEPKSIGLHWFEQTLTTLGTAAFAYASFHLYHLVLADGLPRAKIPAASWKVVG